MFVNELFTDLQLGWVKWIDFGNTGGECWLKVDGVAIMAMRWQFGMGLFQEHV